MNCKKAEKLLLKSFDGLLRNEETQKFEKHLEHCLRCQTKKEQYQAIRRALKEKDYLEPKPYFWERLQPRLKEQKKYEPWSLWKRWSLSAIPLSLVIVLVLPRYRLTSDDPRRRSSPSRAYSTSCTTTSRAGGPFCP